MAMAYEWTAVALGELTEGDLAALDAALTAVKLVVDTRRGPDAMSVRMQTKANHHVPHAAP